MSTPAARRLRNHGQPKREMNDRSTLRSTALAAHEAGLAVVPVDAARKVPTVQWKRYRQTPPDLSRVKEWFESPGRTGLGVLCGKVSGGLTLLEFEAAAVASGLYDLFVETCADEGLGELI